MNKIDGKFYPLQNSEWVKICKSLTKSQISVLYYLRSLDPYGNGIRIKASKIADDLGITKRAVNAAIAVLEKDGLLPDWFEKEPYEDIEYQVLKRLHDEIGGQTEVVTAVGRIDLLTENQVIEVKACPDWKAALGQVLSYSAFFPEHQKRIHLFGAATPEKANLIKSTCLEFGVIVSFEEVESGH
ncbi:hypothetical protein LC612_37060 [Nostoc sp. CHAB 5834]|nr:hypothetical protein [Nostoc sp. CHAB 5834]